MTDKSDAIQATDVAANGGANVDQIREIIFGGQMRDYEKRFARLEESLLKEVDTIRNETSSRLEALETFVRGEFDAAGESLNNEKALREASDKRLNKELDELSQQVSETAADIKEQMGKGQREIRQQLLDQAKTMSGDLSKVRDELTQALQRAQQELGSDKTDRAALAAMFTEMAMRLNGEFELPGDK